jgi:hypothetical protein
LFRLQFEQFEEIFIGYSSKIVLRHRYNEIGQVPFSGTKLCEFHVLFCEFLVYLETDHGRKR